MNVEGLNHTLDDGRKLFNNVSFKIPKGAIVGIIGGACAVATTK